MVAIDSNGRAASLNVDADGQLKIAGTFSAEPPVGGATEAKQDDIITAIEGITIDPPVGGATEAKQDTQITKLTSIDGKLPALGQALAAAAVPVVLTAAQVATLTPPAALTGFATASAQATIISGLSSIDGHVDGLEASASSIDTKTPALGQALAAASTPVVLTAAQVTALTPPAAITGFATQTTLAAVAAQLPSALGKKTVGTSLASNAKSGGDEYETVAASQTTQTIGATGAAGDYLEGLLIVVATAATAQVQIKDGSNTAITVFPNSPGAGVGSYYIPLGLTSVQGAWQVTTGAGSSVIAMGDFT